MVEKRLPALVLAVHDLADENLMVAAGQNIDDPAIQKPQAMSKNRC
jgi:hypothetical protein